MAKRYIKVPFQDSPSTATPLSAAFLNPILNALDACDTEIENKLAIANIANNVITTAPGLVLDARQGKALQDQVTTLNDNLANYKLGVNYLFNTTTAIPANTATPITAITGKAFTNYNFIVMHLVYGGERYSFMCLPASTIAFYLGTNKVSITMSSPYTTMTITSAVAFSLYSIYGM